jgi:hypothetical protein
MRKLPLGLLAIVATFAAIHTATGCGSDNEDGIPPGGDTDGSTDGSNSSGDGSTSNTDGSNNNGDGSSTNDGGKDGGGGSCRLVGQSCGNSTECCTKTCNKPGNVAVGECAPPPDGGSCIAAGLTCDNSTDCCTNSCVSGKCSTAQCKADSPTAEACASNEQCCSGKCDIGGTGKCVPIGVPSLDGGTAGACRTEGNPCGTNSDCCSAQCGANKRCTNLSYCQQNGDVCANDFECCGGSCDKIGSATLGRCSTVGNSNCAPSGTICTGSGCDNKCCSLSCGPLGTTGLTICQPPSGCKPQEELCAKSADCCGGPGRPTGIAPNGQVNDPVECVVESGDSLGRCRYDQCLRPGTVCKAEEGACGGTSNNCCESLFPDGGRPDNDFCNSNPEACCSRDALGIPRCRAVNFVCKPGQTVPAGSVCATSADCCGAPCVNGKCTATCVAKGGACTVSADCCSPEPCVVPIGQTKGICGGIQQLDGGVTQPPADAGTTTPDSGTSTCSLYGQTCTQNSDCCSGVPCTPPGGGGRCRYP